MALDAEAFEACLNRVFVLIDGDYRDELDLVSVDRIPGADVTGERREAFSLVFRGRNRTVLPQRIYRLENDQLGELEIFIVPIAQDDDGVSYEAVFS